MRISDWSSDVCSSDLPVRGPVGCYLLDHAPGETRISDIILAVDEPIRATRCTPGQPFGCRSNKSRCQTHDLWEELGNQIYLYLSSVSVADVIARRVLGPSGLVCCAAGEEIGRESCREKVGQCG